MHFNATSYQINTLGERERKKKKKKKRDLKMVGKISPVYSPDYPEISGSGNWELSAGTSSNSSTRPLVHFHPVRAVVPNLCVTHCVPSSQPLKSAWPVLM